MAHPGGGLFAPDKCTLCSRCIDDDLYLLVFSHGSVYHWECWIISKATSLLGESTVLVRRSRELIQRSRELIARGRR